MDDMPKHPRLYRRGAVYYHRAAVPKDIQGTYGKSEEIRSLKTKDRQEALRQVRIEAARVDQLFQAHRERIAAPSLEDLTDEQVRTLASAFYAAILREDEDERLKGFPQEEDFALYGTDIEAVEQIARREYATGGRPSFVVQTFDDMTAAIGVNWKLTEASPAWPKLTRAFLAETIKAAEVKRRRNSGDVLETPPIPTVSTVAKAPEEPHVSLRSLLDLWKRDHRKAGKAEKSVTSKEARVEDFITFLGHDDAKKVTGKSVADYCETLLHERGLSAKTVATGYLADIRVVFRTGKAKFQIGNDPTEGVKVRVPKKVRARSPGFNDEEANAILSCALDASRLPSGMSELNKLSCRWIPWLCAYTGARVGEIAQLRKQDFVEEYGIPCILISPEAGTVKTGKYRHVPLHPHLIEIGILRFANSRPEGHLFFVPNDRKLGHGRNQWDKVTDNLRDFVRDIVKVTDPRIGPNHAWRHRFKTVARDVGINPRYMDAIQGHEDGTASSDYGENTMKALSREIRKMPRCLTKPRERLARSGLLKPSPTIAALSGTVKTGGNG